MQLVRDIHHRGRSAWRFPISSRSDQSFPQSLGGDSCRDRGTKKSFETEYAPHHTDLPLPPPPPHPPRAMGWDYSKWVAPIMVPPGPTHAFGGLLTENAARLRMMGLNLNVGSASNEFRWSDGLWYGATIAARGWREGRPDEFCFQLYWHDNSPPTDRYRLNFQLAGVRSKDPGLRSCPRSCPSLASSAGTSVGEMSTATAPSTAKT